MTITIPDAAWYRRLSLENSAPVSCPYANVRKCPRYYASVALLGDAKITTSINDSQRTDLKAFWQDSGLNPVIAEDDTSINGDSGHWSSFSNFCPEVTFKYFHYYADYLSKYADEIDRDCGYRIAVRDKVPNDWRYEWQSVSGCHFLGCSVYDQVHDFNLRKVGKLDRLVHPNVVTLIDRMEHCLEMSDQAGVLHAAATILETMAKDVLNSDSIQDQTLGGFVEKYKKESNLPDNIKSVVEYIYKLRNITPLSGHGSTNAPNITMQDAVIIAAATKFIVEVEYRVKKL